MHKGVVTTATHLLCNHHTTALQLQFDAWKLIRVDDKVIVMCVCVCAVKRFFRDNFVSFCHISKRILYLCTHRCNNSQY